MNISFTYKLKTTITNPTITTAFQYLRRNMSYRPKVEVDKTTNYYTISPQDDTNHSASVIFFHGLGDTAAGWADTMYQLSRKLNHVKFILPTATSKPVTLNMGMSMPSWYDIKSLSSRDNDTCDGIEDSRQLAHNLINKEIESGIDPSRIILGGFSQGGALSLYTGYQMTKKNIGGVMVLSGYVPNFKVSSPTQTIPMIMCHGDSDMVVQFEWAKKSKELLTQQNVKEIEWHVYGGMEHSACMEEIDHVEQWLRKIIPSK